MNVSFKINLLSVDGVFSFQIFLRLYHFFIVFTPQFTISHVKRIHRLLCKNYLYILKICILLLLKTCQKVLKIPKISSRESCVIIMLMIFVILSANIILISHKKIGRTKMGLKTFKVDPHITYERREGTVDVSNQEVYLRTSGLSLSQHRRTSKSIVWRLIPYAESEDCRSRRFCFLYNLYASIVGHVESHWTT